MSLNAPTKIVFLLSLLLAVIAIIAALNVVSFIPIGAVWIMTAAYVVLAAGTFFKGM